MISRVVFFPAHDAVLKAAGELPTGFLGEVKVRGDRTMRSMAARVLIVMAITAIAAA